jgi:hypothetical protein
MIEKPMTCPSPVHLLHDLIVLCLAEGAGPIIKDDFEKITFPIVPNPQTAVGHNTRPFFTLSVNYAVMTNVSPGRTLTTTHKYFGPTSVWARYR